MGRSDEDAGGQVIAAEEGADIHTFFAGYLDFLEADGSIGCIYQQVLAAVAGYCSWLLDGGSFYRSGGVDLEVLLCSVG